MVEKRLVRIFAKELSIHQPMSENVERKMKHPFKERIRVILLCPLGLLMLLWYYFTMLLTFPIGALAMRIVEKEPVRESWGRLMDELKESFSGGEMID